MALRITEKAAAVAARTGNPTLEVRALVGIAQTLSYMGQWIPARQIVEQTLAKMPGIEDDLTRAFVLGHLGFCYMRAGDSGQALRLLHKGIVAARQVGDRQKESRFDINIGFIYIQLGRYAQACAAFEDGLALAEALGDQATQSTLRYNLSYAYWRSGDRDQAQITGEQALKEFQLTGTNTLGHACCLEYLGIYREERGEWSTAVAYLAQARSMYDSIAVRALKMEAQAIEARCRLAMGQIAEARQLATEVWAYMCEHGTEGIDFPALVSMCLVDIIAKIPIPDITEHDVLSAGYAQLMHRADMIDDPEWRRPFLEDEISNKALIARWQRIKDGDLQRNIQG